VHPCRSAQPSALFNRGRSSPRLPPQAHRQPRRHLTLHQPPRPAAPQHPVRRLRGLHLPATKAVLLPLQVAQVLTALSRTANLTAPLSLTNTALLRSTTSDLVAGLVFRSLAPTMVAFPTFSLPQAAAVPRALTAHTPARPGIKSRSGHKLRAPLANPSVVSTARAASFTLPTNLCLRASA